MAYQPYQTYQPNWNFPNYSQNSMAPYPNYAQQPQQSMAHSMIGVDGEVGAKAYQMPQGWPANLPIPLWDTNDTVIYLKSINQMGMPNPLQKIRYTIEDQQQQSMLPAASQQGNSYATKEDMESMRSEMREIRDMLKNQSNNSNRNNNNQQNRGGQ